MPTSRRPRTAHVERSHTSSPTPFFVTPVIPFSTSQPAASVRSSSFVPSLRPFRASCLHAWNTQHTKNQSHKYYYHVIRSALPAVAPPAVKPEILKAIDDLSSRQARVTPSDVATIAGVSLPDAESALFNLSATLQSGVDVTSSGDLSYRLGRNIRRRLRNLSTRYRFQEISSRVKKWGVWAVKRAFGVTLGASILITFAAIFAILTAASASSNDDNGGRRRGGYGSSGLGMRIGFNLLDLFWYPRYRGYYYYDGYDSPYGRMGMRDSRRRGMRRDEEGKEKKGPGFLEAIYSCVFGDGNPNAGLEERRWSKIADIIRANNGAIVAEQVAGLLDVPSDWKPAGQHEDESDGSVSHVDESFMMEVARRFNGRPEVTDDGDVIYVFPEMVTTGDSDRGRKSLESSLRDRLFGSITTSDRQSGGLQSALSTMQMSKEPVKEERWTMTRATAPQQVLVGGLGVLNGFGVTVLGDLLGQVGNVSGIVGLARGLYPLLAIYAASYIAVPAIRWLWMQGANRAIDARNKARERTARAVTSRPVLNKIAAAEKYALEHNVVREKDVIFRSDREIGVGADGMDEEDFDRRLEDAAKRRR